jgi:histidinol phosphatase-like enzyme
MKKIVLMAFFTLVLGVATMMGQAKKPTIMVVPSDVWCNTNGYVQEYDELGTKKTMSDYTAALQNSMELKLVIAKINELMADRGFPLKDLEATMNSIARMQAEEALIT